jgi:mercuric ion binding protein
MKKIKYIVIALIAITVASCGDKAIKENNKITTEISNGVATSTFKVWGNCEMCKETIEGSLKLNGISKADWNTESKMITVIYDSAKISLDQIQKNISSVGYDTDKYKGDDKAYKELADCCQYDRK